MVSVKPGSRRLLEFGGISEPAETRRGCRRMQPGMSTTAQLIIISVLRTILNTLRRMVYPFLSVFARGLGVDVTAFSLALTGRNVVGIFGPLLAPISDVRGRKLGMLSGVALFTLGTGTGGPLAGRANFRGGLDPGDAGPVSVRSRSARLLWGPRGVRAARHRRGDHRNFLVRGFHCRRTRHGPADREVRLAGSLPGAGSAGAGDAGGALAGDPARRPRPDNRRRRCPIFSPC